MDENSNIDFYNCQIHQRWASDIVEQMPAQVLLQQIACNNFDLFRLIGAWWFTTILLGLVKGEQLMHVQTN